MTIYVDRRAATTVTFATIMFRNAAGHFHARAPSWFMAFMTFGVGIAMTVNPHMLVGVSVTHLYFGYMVALADQYVWRALFLAVGTARILALLINGSFSAVTWTPLVRAVTSGVSAVLWSVVALSVVGGEMTIGTIVYPGIVLIELYNMTQAARDWRGGRSGYFWH